MLKELDNKLDFFDRTGQGSLFAGILKSFKVGRVHLRMGKTHQKQFSNLMIVGKQASI